MSDNTMQEILKRVDALAAKLGVTADQLWGMLMKQASVELWSSLLWIMLLSLLLVASVFATSRAARRMAKDKDTANDFLLMIGGLLGIVVGTIGIAVTLSAIPTLIFNPEYWALKQLIH